MKSTSSHLEASVALELVRLALDIRQGSLLIAQQNGRIRDTLDMLLAHLPDSKEQQSVPELESEAGY